MNFVTAFSPDYVVARQRFREAAAQLGWVLESHAIGCCGPGGEDLTIDVACSAAGDPGRVLVVSSGIHGVEGFLGSGVQVELLRRWGSSQAVLAPRCVFLHGLNPFGFAWLRRVDENNVDPNRNFLLPGQRYEGCPAGYAELDGLLNPRRAVSRWEPFMLKAMGTIARHGMPALRQAVAAGQYEFPKGLFYGGSGPTRAQQVLAQHWQRWLRGSRQVVHLDFHSGLGRKGACKLLIDYPLTAFQCSQLSDWFGSDSFEACDSRNISYDTRGGFGAWCVSRDADVNYLFAYAEFGTFHPLRVLAGLRAENQTHHWGVATDAAAVQAKHHLKELFCPSAKSWRSAVLDQSIELINRAIEGLANVSDAWPERTTI